MGSEWERDRKACIHAWGKEGSDWLMVMGSLCVHTQLDSPDILSNTMN